MRDEFKYKETIDVDGVQFFLGIKKPVIDILTGYYRLDNQEKKTFNKYITSACTSLSVRPKFENEFDGMFRIRVESKELAINGEELTLEEDFDQEGDELELQFEMISEGQHVQKINFSIEIFVEDDDEPSIKRNFSISLDCEIA